MENLIILPTKSTLSVNFNAKYGILDLSGSSYPDNSSEFFQPIYNWLEQYIQEVNNPIELNFRINYFNTSSSKCLYKLLSILQKYHINKGEVNVTWHYNDGDDDILDAFKELVHDLSLPYKIDLG